MNEIFVIDNVIPKKYQDEIETVLTGQFPWYFYSEAVYKDTSNIPQSENSKTTPVFVHNFLNNEEVVSDYYNLIKPLLYYVEEKVSINFEKVYRAKSNLLMPKTGYENFNHSYPHVDQLFPHLSLLYYVNDSDGDTFFFDKKYDETAVTNEVKLKVFNQITPKKGRAILFDGLIYHSSSNPINSDKRIVLNYNLAT
jgi:hypothetical protein